MRAETSPGKAKGDGKGCHRPPQKMMHPGSERHWLMYLAEPGPSVLRHLYGGHVSSCPIETFAWQKTGQNESSICIHTHKSTATELGGSQRHLTKCRSLPALEVAPESQDTLCWQPFRHQFRFIVKSKLLKTPQISDDRNHTCKLH